MNRKRAKELLPVIEAFANGEEIQFRIGPDDDWMLLGGTITGWHNGVQYRIKPKKRILWFDPTDGEVLIQESQPNPDFIKFIEAGEGD